MTTINNKSTFRQNKIVVTITHILIAWAVPIGLVILWQILAQTGVLSTRILPAPTDVVRATVEQWHSGDLWKGMLISSARAGLGFAIGGSIGFLLGLVNGLFPWADKVLDSSVQMLRNVPHLAMIPLVILWFGIGEEAKVFLVVLGVFFPIYLNTYHGIRSIDVKLREMGVVYGLNPLQLFWQVILPDAMSSILVGLRFALGLMWLTLIVAETISADSGIGYITMNAREFMRTDVVVMGILLYALLGKLADSAARLIERRLLQWQLSNIS